MKQIKYIAEIGSNWYTSKDMDVNYKNLAKLLDQFPTADLIKFQAWNTPKFIHPEHPGYETFQQYELPIEWYAPLINKLGDRFMATAFDTATADELYKLGQSQWKIASGDITNLPLISHIAKFGQPTYLSTGNANMWEIKRAIDLIRKFNVAPLTVLHCISKYPIGLEECGFKRLSKLITTYPNLIIGWSSHVVPSSATTAAVSAVTLGAEVIEVHVTGYPTSKVPDEVVSLTPSQFSELTTTTKQIQTALATEPVVNESELCWARRGDDGLRPWLNWSIRDGE